jgi:hypothetical protein
MIHQIEMKIMGIFASCELLYDLNDISEPYLWDDVYYEGMGHPFIKREITNEWGAFEL